MTTPEPPGELLVSINNADILDLIPISVATVRPDGADSSKLDFVTNFAITTSSGTLIGTDALDFLSLNFHITSVLLTCLDGTPLPIDVFATCGGSTVEEKQSRKLSLIGTALGGVLLDPEDPSEPFLTIIMTEEASSERIVDPSDPMERQAPQAEPRGKDYVADMGMHW